MVFISTRGMKWSFCSGSRRKPIMTVRSWCQECGRTLHPEVKGRQPWAHICTPGSACLFYSYMKQDHWIRAAHLGQVFRLINTTFTEMRKVLPHLGKPSLSHLSQIILNLSSWQLKVIITCTLIQICQTLEFTKRQNPKDFLSLYTSLDTTCLSLFVTKRRF